MPLLSQQRAARNPSVACASEPLKLTGTSFCSGERLEKVCKVPKMRMAKKLASTANCRRSRPLCIQSSHAASSRTGTLSAPFVPPDVVSFLRIMRLSQKEISVSHPAASPNWFLFLFFSHRRPFFSLIKTLSSSPDLDASHLLAAVEASRASDGRVAPHPRSGCVIVVGGSGSISSDGGQRQQVLSSGHTAGEGASPAEVVAVSALRRLGFSSSSSDAPLSVYLSLEPDATPAGAGALEALLALGSGNNDSIRVVLGMLHPLAHARGRGAAALAAAGFEVHVLGDGEGRSSSSSSSSSSNRRSLLAAARAASLEANEGLLARAATGRPLGLLKYAMTLDGKIATSAGHAAWVSSPESRGRVFAARARANAVVVGGNTVRRDNPRLTNREVFSSPNGASSGGSSNGGDELLSTSPPRHSPLRICMSRTLDLPMDAALWDTTAAPTVVATQRGARPHTQKLLSEKGVEVVEFDHLCPGALADWCAARGHLHVLWECGGTLAAPALGARVIHKVMAFVAPKIIGGGGGGGGSSGSGGTGFGAYAGRAAPTPVGDLGLYEMTQALPVEPASNYSPGGSLLENVDFWQPANAWEPVGPDILFTGYLPTAGGGPPALDAAAAAAASAAGASPASAAPARAAPLRAWPAGARSSLAGFRECKLPRAAEVNLSSRKSPSSSSSSANALLPAPAPVAFFKSWDVHGELSNFSPHPIEAPMGPVVGGGGEKELSNLTSWATVEHFYQAQKFTHPASSALSSSDLEASKALVEAIRAAPTPVDAASLGRAAQRSSPRLVRADWEDAKLDVMIFGLKAKFTAHAAVRNALLATEPRQVAEASPSDHFWGSGVDGSGCNHLGRLLAEVRAELSLSKVAEEREAEEERGAVVNGHQQHRRHNEQQQQQSKQQPSKTTPVGR